MYLFSVIELIDRYCPLLLFPKSKYFSANFKNTNKYIPARIQNRILSPSVNAEFPSKIIRTKSRISGMTLPLKTLFSMSNLDASSQNISSSCSIKVAGFLKYVQPPKFIRYSQLQSSNIRMYSSCRFSPYSPAAPTKSNTAFIVIPPSHCDTICKFSSVPDSEPLCQDP